MSGSASSAPWASGGLQAPRIDVAVALDAELRAQGRLDVDLAEDAEALRGELLADALDGVVEGERGRRAQCVAAADCRHASSRSRARARAALARCESACEGSGNREPR